MAGLKFGRSFRAFRIWVCADLSLRGRFAAPQGLRRQAIPSKRRVPRGNASIVRPSRVDAVDRRRRPRQSEFREYRQRLIVTIRLSLC